MCGIAGALDWSGATAVEDVAVMTHALRHRGPDGDGFFHRDGVALGHRRLAIIDLEGGKQPLSNETGSVWITFNGEIYNYKLLRDELIAHGHQFRTQSDTETIVHGYEEWGDDVVCRLRGMFAFAIADFDKNRLFLARDHFGIKPLFYRFCSQRIIFASELAAIQKVQDRATRLRPESLEWFLRYRYIPGPNTIYRDIQQLTPASRLSLDFNGGNRKESRYWKLQFCPQPGPTDAQWLDEFEAVLHESVRAHLVADVPFGVFLSGGIDSTNVARAMRNELSGRLVAFSIGFDEERFSELRYAQEAAKTLGIELYTETITPDIVDLLPRLVAHYGQPYADTSMIPTWYLARLVRRHVPMALSGDGGDEAFAGYDRYPIFLRDNWSYELLGLLLRPWQLARRMPRLGRRLCPSEANRLACWDDWVAMIPKEARRKLWKREFAAITSLAPLRFRQAFAEGASLEPLEQVQYVDIMTYLPDDILTKVDIATMYHGLEARPPLVDVKVAEFAARLPMAQRFGNCKGGNVGFTWPIKARHEYPWTLKYLPKQVLRRQFSDAFVDRPKMGFSIPEDRWLHPGTPVRALFDQFVADPRAPMYEWLRHDTVNRWIQQRDRTGQGSAILWALLTLAMWLSQTPGVQMDSFSTQAASI